MGIKNLSPVLWEGLKWRLPEPFHKVVLKDDKTSNGNYEKGEAYFVSDSKEVPLSDEQAAVFEASIASQMIRFGPEAQMVLARLGAALKAVSEGKCYNASLQLEDCSGPQASKAAEALASMPPSDLQVYASPLRKASDNNPRNAEIAFAAGEALFAKGEFKTAIPYYLRANAYANFSDPRLKLALCAYEIRDWARLKVYLTSPSDPISQMVPTYIVHSGIHAKGEQSLENIIKAVYALVTFYGDKGRKLVREKDLMKDLPSYEKGLAKLLKRYPIEFRDGLDSLRRSTRRTK